MNEDYLDLTDCPLRLETIRAATRAELLTQIQAIYATTIQRVDYPSLSMEVLKAANPDHVLEEAVQSEETSNHGSPSWQPYWAEAWESAVALGSWLIREGVPAANGKSIRVLDLGCGLGVAGAVAAHLGCEVVLGDNAPPALPFALWNVWPWRDRAEVCHIDWNKDRFDKEDFDVVLGADILYERESWPAQDEFCRRHLKMGGTLLLAEPNRRLSDDFPVVFRSRDWQVEGWMYHPPEIPKAIRMFKCSRLDGHSPNNDPFDHP